MMVSFRDLVSIGNVAVFSLDHKGFLIYPLWRHTETKDCYISRFNNLLTVQPTGQAFHSYPVWTIENNQ